MANDNESGLCIGEVSNPDAQHWWRAAGTLLWATMPMTQPTTWIMWITTTLTSWTSCWRQCIGESPVRVTANGQRLLPYQSLSDLQNLIWGVPGFCASGTTVYVRLAGDADPSGGEVDVGTDLVYTTRADEEGKMMSKRETLDFYRAYGDCP